MKRFNLILLILMVVLMALTVVMKVVGTPFLERFTIQLLPLIVFFFALMDYIQYWFIVRAMEEKSPRSFIKVFLGCTMAVTLLHLGVIVACVLLNPVIAKYLALCYLVLYLIFTVYLIGALVVYVRKVQKQ